MELIDEAILRWHEMANSVVTVDLTKSCDSPCNDKFASNTVALCYLGLESPFKEGSDLDNDWQDLMYFYRQWRDRETHTDCAYKKRFVKFAQKIVEAHPRCPFGGDEEDVSVEEVREHELNRAEAEDIERGTYVPVREPKVVETLQNDPPKRFFNIFRRRRK